MTYVPASHCLAFSIKRNNFFFYHHKNFLSIDLHIILLTYSLLIYTIFAQSLKFEDMAPVAAQTMDVTSIKSLAESPALSYVPSAYAFNINPNDEADPNDPEFAIPIVDMSLLTSRSPDQRSKIIHDVKICQEWGFFIVSSLTNY